MSKRLLSLATIIGLFAGDTKAAGRILPNLSLYGLRSSLRLRPRLMLTQPLNLGHLGDDRGVPSMCTDETEWSHFNVTRPFPIYRTQGQQNL